MTMQKRKEPGRLDADASGTGSQGVVFRGNMFNVDRQSWVPALILYTASYYVIFGSLWYRVAMIVPFWTAPFWLALYFMGVRWNWFSFDDLRRSILMPWNRRIPYERLKSIDVRETLGHLSVSIRLSRFNSIWLIRGLPAERKDEVLENFQKRFPELNIRLRRWSNLIPRLAWVVPVAYMLGVSTWFHFWVYSNHPSVGLVPEQRKFTGVQTAVLAYREYGVEDFTLSLPTQLGDPEHKEDGLVFRDSPWKTTLAVYSRPSALPKLEGDYLLRFVFGIRDIYDLHKWIYYSRIGCIPLLLKWMYTSETHNMKMYEMEQDGLRGFLTTGIEKKRRVATITFIDKVRERELDIFIFSTRPLDDRMLERIIASVRSVDSDTSHEAHGE